MLTTISLISGGITLVGGGVLYALSAFTYDDPNVTVGTYLIRYSMWSVAPIGVTASALSIITQNPAFLGLNLIPLIGFGAASIIAGP